MSCCSKPSETASETGACATESKCCPIAKLQCMGSCLGPLLLRLTLAATMFPHGAQKVLGWYGGYGFSGTYHHFTENMHIPAPFAVAGILAEFVFPIMLVLGLFTRFAALGLVIQMAVAAVLGHHIDNGFFMNWFGTLGADGKALPHGYEYLLLYGGAALALAFIGPGKVALDSVVCCLLGKKKGCCPK